MIELKPFIEREYKDLYIETMKLMNEEIDSRQFIKDNYYYSMIEAVYLHCFEELDNDSDLKNGKSYRNDDYAKEIYLDAAVDIYCKIHDLNEFFGKNTKFFDYELLIYISGQFIHYFIINKIYFNETEETFAGKILDKYTYAEANPFRRLKGKRIGGETDDDTYIYINDLIYKSKKRNDELARDMGISLDEIKLLRAGRIQITKDLLYGLFFALNLTSHEIRNFLKKIPAGSMVSNSFKGKRDKFLFSVMDNMIMYRNLEENQGKSSISIANAILEKNKEQSVQINIAKEERQDNIRTILLTGGFGFIGKHCINYFNRLNEKNEDGIRYRICVLARSIPQDYELPENVSCYFGNISNELVYERILSENEVDYIIHLAAISTVEAGADGLVETLNVNGQSASYIYNVIKRNQFPVKCVILPSTVQVYQGAKEIGPVCKETDSIDLKEIRNVYASSKYIAESEAEMFAREGVPNIIVRLSNVYGEGDTNARLIPKTMQRLYEGLAPMLYVDTQSNKTDYLNLLYIEDLVRAFDKILKETEKNGYHYNSRDIIFNIGSEESYYTADIVKMLMEIMEKDCEPEIVYTSFGRERLLSVKKAEKEFGIRSLTDVKDGLRKTVDWYIKHREEQ